MKHVVFASMLAACAPAAAQTQKENNPVELGDVSWGRDVEAAHQQSEKSGKPVFILFNEVPGCSTVRGFGKTALKDPIVVEAIETLFEPVVVYNNKGGADRKILNAYKEPTWNNPIVRTFNADKKELTKRFNGPYNSKTLVSRMVSALKAADRPVPSFLADYQKQLSAVKKTATFAMYCFWTGETKFAQIPGVLTTKAGFQNGHEVVQVTYDGSELSYEELVVAAKKLRAADTALVASKSEASIAKSHFGDFEFAKGKMRFSKKDDKYHLRRSKLRNLPLSDVQATRVNSALGLNQDPSVHLTPRQKPSR